MGLWEDNLRLFLLYSTGFHTRQQIESYRSSKHVD